jgi:hypothetical protein
MAIRQTENYRAALRDARAAFDTTKNRLNQINFEMLMLQHETAKLRRTITALAAMCSEPTDLDPLGITNFCAEVMEAQQGAVTTADVVKALGEMGFDLSSQKNASASVHSVLTRLAKKGKIEKAGDGEAVRWKGPKFDPNYADDIPF